MPRSPRAPTENVGILGVLKVRSLRAGLKHTAHSRLELREGEHMEEMGYRERAWFISGAGIVPISGGAPEVVTGWGGQGWMTFFRALRFSFLVTKQTTCLE